MSTPSTFFLEDEYRLPNADSRIDAGLAPAIGCLPTTADAPQKSDLYASLWASCDALRGGTDASMYKNYVLFMLFIKYVSDKYANSTDFAPAVVIATGASFADMARMKGLVP
jgi:type I restriction enzyme M protein